MQVEEDGVEVEVEIDNENVNPDDEQTIASGDSADDAVSTSDSDGSDEHDNDEEVQQYSKNVQKRISKLTHKLREAERREQAAIQYAQGVQEQLTQHSNQLNSQVQSKDAALFTQYSKNIESQLMIAKENYKRAHAEGDVDLMMEAQSELAKYSVEMENLRRVAAKRTRQQAQNVERQQRPQQIQQLMYQQQAAKQPEVDEKAQAWAEENDWFGKDEVMTYAAFGIHRKLVEEGVDTTSDLYYNRLNSELKSNFPKKFSSSDSRTMPHQQVAGASRTGRASGSDNKIKLTRSQVDIANRLGVPLSEYAKFLKRGN